MPSGKAVCIVSGGMDSVCYSAVLGQKFELYMITFSYGQRAKREISRAREFSRVLKAGDHKVVDISFMKDLYGKSNALTDAAQRLPRSFERNLVVPVRNAIFLTIATAWAMSINAKTVAYGAHTGDTESYPDCRPEFSRSLEQTLNLAEADGIAAGTRGAVSILSPAIEKIDKPSLIRAGHRILGDGIFRTWSCYSDGIRLGRNYVHCGRCESCINRKVALYRAGIEDKTHYAENSSGQKPSAAKRDIYKH